MPDKQRYGTRQERVESYFSIPVEERINYYFTLGYKAEDIAEIVSAEYQEFELNPITVDSVKYYYRRNKTMISEVQNKYLLNCREKLAEDLKVGFTLAQKTENAMVRSFSKKIEELVEQLDQLDITEKDPDTGYFKNMGQYGTLVLAINETHKTLEKISGTAAAREVMVYMKKAYVKEEAARGAGLHGAATEAEVTFMDDDMMTNIGIGEVNMKENSQGLPELRKVN